ncbi:amino acid permease [Streptomyces sp. NPDC006743]|uniref:APC family permease n=1 Tax=Streptomyces sp. NPDC006743 TaxID=3154480 RepID=UPI003456285C
MPDVPPGPSSRAALPSSRAVEPSSPATDLSPRATGSSSRPAGLPQQSAGPSSHAPGSSPQAAQGTTDPAGRSGGGEEGTLLRRTLRLRHIVFLGLAFMAPLAVFDTFGLVSETTDGHVPLAYLAVLVAVGLTALSYARMARRITSAGSVYTYAGKALGAPVGFLVGWSATLDYVLLPMLNALLAAIYMGAVVPGVPAWVWVLSTVVVCTALNLVGVRPAAKVNVALVAVQAAVAVAFLVFAVRAVVTHGESFGTTGFGLTTVPLPDLLSGASLLALSFLGFDAVSTLSEEAERPRRDIPRAILLIVAAAGVFFLAVTYVMQTLFPDVSAVGDIVGASPEIAEYIGGAAFQAVFVGGYLTAVLGCGLTQQMSAARLLFAMGRDGMLPRAVFGRLDPRTGVPAVNVVLVGVVAASAVFLDLGSAASLINFGAYVAFAAVNVAVIGFWVRDRRAGRSEARGAVAAALQVLLPALGFVVNVALWLSLDTPAKIVGIVWAALGVGILALRTGGFRRPARTVNLEE